MVLERAPRLRRQATVGMGLWIALGLLFGGCATVEHIRRAGAVANQTLSTTSGRGQEQLRIEADYDSAIRNLISHRGRPDYLHIVNRGKIYLFFIKKDVVVLVKRELIPPGETTVFKRTPGFLLKLLPADAADAVIARRKTQERNARRNQPKTLAARSSRPPPAARAPNSTISISNFDSRSIVTRLSTPLSAADSGVSGWSRGRRRDGTVTQIADDGITRYQIGPDFVIVGARIGAKRRSSSEAIRFGVYRLNRAIYGAGAAAVDRHVEPLVAKVAADPSGRTKLTQRVAGRTVLVSRDPKRGYLFYTISAH
jgi:hypothetical protein